jgi:hypothetical protein
MDIKEFNLKVLEVSFNKLVFLETLIIFIIIRNLLFIIIE